LRCPCSSLSSPREFFAAIAKRVAGKPFRGNRGEIEAECRRFDEPDHFGDELLKTGVTSDEIGLRELVPQIARERVRFVPEKNGADIRFVAGPLRLPWLLSTQTSSSTSAFV
jgi:hypothetical protein